jgi:hypothetical protein
MTADNNNDDKTQNEQKDEQRPLKGFFKSGENYVTLLDCKTKLLSRLLEKEKGKKE